MARSVEHFLEQRARRTSAGRSPACVVTSVAFHGAIAAAIWLVPDLFAKPPELVDYYEVIVVPPQVLGIEEPPPPPPPEPEPPPPEPPPPEPEPAPETVPEDVPVLVEEQKKKPEKKPPPEPKPQPPPPPAVEPPPKRVGSPFGNPLGSTNQATLGVEDPNFTYGYYLDRVVAAISANWRRPPMGSLEAKLHFRIQRDGTITRLRVVTSSGQEAYDAAALRAVEASSPLPPLPKGYTEDDLGIYLIVR